MDMFKLFDIIFGAMSLFLGITNVITLRQNHIHTLSQDDQDSKNDTERLAYERVTAVLNEIEIIKKELEDARREISILTRRLDQRDQELGESERIKVWALSRVTSLKEDNEKLKEEITQLKKGN